MHLLIILSGCLLNFATGVPVNQDLPWPASWQDAYNHAEHIGATIRNVYDPFRNTEPHIENLNLKDSWSALAQKMIDLVPSLPEPLRAADHWVYGLSPTVPGQQQYCVFYPEKSMLKDHEVIASLNALKAQIMTHIDFTRAGMQIMDKYPFREYKGHVGFEMFIHDQKRPAPPECADLGKPDLRTEPNADMVD